MNLSAHQAKPTVNLQLLVGHGASLLITSFGIEWELHIYACFVGLFWFVVFLCGLVFFGFFFPCRYQLIVGKGQGYCWSALSTLENTSVLSQPSHLV